MYTFAGKSDTIVSVVTKRMIIIILMRKLILTALFVAVGLTYLGRVDGTAAEERSQQENSDERIAPVSKIEATVYFRQGRAEYDETFRGNYGIVDSFVSQLRDIAADPSACILSVRITGGASPEGLTDYQRVLSHERVECLERIVRSAVWLPSGCVQEDALGIDWKGLTCLVEKSQMPYRDRTLDILRNTPEWIRYKGEIVDGRKQQLKLLAGGRPWEYMYIVFFPDLRRATIEVSYSCKKRPCAETPQKEIGKLNPCAETPQKETGKLNPCAETPRKEAEERPCGNGLQKAEKQTPDRDFLMAVKTNTLYDLDLVPNLGAEFHLGNNWTLGSSVMYAWWSDTGKDLFYRIYGADFSVRKYFGSKALSRPMSGHHLGLYTQVYTYDFEFGGTGYMGGLPGGTIWDRANWGAGLEYGYSVPLGSRFNIDFSLGAGYTTGKYEVYAPIDNHYVWQMTRKKQFLGPTKAEISLVWLIGAVRHKSK